jgi:3-methylcrotonyl-CoA carboxylase alpha subunit
LIESKGLTFVGPPADAIRKMGSKSESKRIMEANGVPILKGYHGERNEPEFLLSQAKEIGFPVMLKASLGGGGKGMRIVHTEAEFMDQLDAAKREAMKGFNDDHMIIEKYVVHPRHIEIQVFGDKHGTRLHCAEAPPEDH